MNNKCPKCSRLSLKPWQELSEEEKMAVRVKYSDFSAKERKKHRFCLHCGYEEITKNILA